MRNRKLARVELGQDAVITYLKFLRTGLREPLQTSSSKEIETYEYKKQVPAEIAKRFSHQFIGKIKMPLDIEQELERSVRQAGLKGRKLREAAKSLTDKLREMSRTMARGGVNDKPSRLVEMRSQMKYRNPRQNMLVFSLMKSGHSPGLSRAVSEIVQPAGDFVDQRTQEHQNLVPDYDKQQSLVYTAVRAPACYAAVYRVMKELRQRDPAFRPSRMLDFGCGPGTAVWAAQEVWGYALEDVVAVDHADEMLSIGSEIQRRRSKSGQWIPRIRWLMRFPGLTRKSFFPSLKRKYNLVVATYVLGEITDKYEREYTARSLWSQCSDMMIIMEPGTPVGSQIVREIRAMILKEENKRADKTTGNKPKGAYVVAPCPHDGPCPMDKQSSWWCHFNQRFERTLVQRICKIREGGGKARDYQDERYSYVVLRRGQRPRVDDVAIDPLYVTDEPEDVEYAALPTKVTQKLALSDNPVFISEIFPNIQEEDVSEEDDELVAMKLLMQRMNLPAIEEPQNDIQVLRVSGRQQLEKSQDKQTQTLKESDSQQKDEYKDREVKILRMSNQDVEKTVNNEQSQQHQSQLSLGQSGLEVSMDHKTIEQSVEECQQPREKGLQDNDQYIYDDQQSLNSQQMDQNYTKQTPSLLNGETLVSKERTDDLINLQNNEQLAINQEKSNKLIEFDDEKNSLPELDYWRFVDWDVEDPESVRATAQACSRWGRLLRPPFKKEKRVVIHVCAPEGVIQKRVIVRRDSKRYWFGKAGYRMARKSRWGDLWPTFYDGNDRIEKLGKSFPMKEFLSDEDELEIFEDMEQSDEDE